MLANQLFFTKIDSSEDCMAIVVKLLHTIARDILKQKNKCPFFKGGRRIWDKFKTTQCWICEKTFWEVEYSENWIDLDHCHLSGYFFWGGGTNSVNEPVEPSVSYLS